jgi:hypothetical protein
MLFHVISKFQCFAQWSHQVLRQDDGSTDLLGVTRCGWIGGTGWSSRSLRWGDREKRTCQEMCQWSMTVSMAHGFMQGSCAEQDVWQMACFFFQSGRWSTDFPVGPAPMTKPSLAAWLSVETELSNRLQHVAACQEEAQGNRQLFLASAPWITLETRL